MRVGVDLDGVVAEFVNPFLEEVAKRWGVEKRREDVVCYDFDTAFGFEDGRCRELIKELGRKCFYDTLPPVPGAVDGLQQLAAQHNVVIVTGRPEWALRKTERWLRTHGLGHLEVRRAARLEKHTTGFWDVFIEDDGEEAVKLACVCGLVLLFHEPWNARTCTPCNVLRVSSWDEALETIRRRPCARPPRPDGERVRPGARPGGRVAGWPTCCFVCMGIVLPPCRAEDAKR